nr:hypothetical protein [Tanacetum cinerariifolium]
MKEKLTKFEESSKNLTNLINSQMSANDKTGLGYDSQLSENEMPECEIFKTASNSSVYEIDEDNNQLKVRYKVGIGYHAVPPPYTGNYMPPRADLSFARLDDYVFKFKISETRTSVNENESTFKSSEEIREEPKIVRLTAPIIEDWESDYEDECMDKTSTEQEISSNDNSIKSVECDVDEISRNDDVCQGNEIRIDSSTQAVNAASSSINTANNIIDAGSLNINIVDSNHTNMPTLEATGIFDGVFDDKDLGREEQIIKIFRTACLLVSCPKWKPRRMYGLWWIYLMEKELLAQNRIEAIRLFLAYASFKDFIVYHMDVKSEFLYGKIKEEVYVCQPPRFEDSDFPDKVYKVKKALYGLHQAPSALYETLSTYLLNNRFKRGQIDKTLFIKRNKGDILLVQVYVDDIIFGSTKKEIQDKYVAETLKKFGFSEVKTPNTPMGTSKPLLKHKDGQEVDVHMYGSMIGSLMYLTSSRPDIMFVVCACTRHQVSPKVSHLHSVKRIFRYPKRQPKLVLWYLKDSPIELEAYTDSDYEGSSLDGKSTTSGCQFLGCRLISWQCEKQTVVAKSTTKAEYIAASSCCR